MKGFWNDPDGLTTAELTILAVLPLYLFVGVKLALTKDLSANQVDFFSVLSYPILAAIAKQAIERIGWPNIGRRQLFNQYQQYQDYNGYSYIPSMPQEEIINEESDTRGTI
ncbi:hypothetical protein D2962_09375 [Biomaibacter acetigenes]|uniref:Uncharacterized protein n=1 Tax=Biomaibacter acetigenes TaxID=2316383 RepID=A0A3G2R5V9_9FIRM|nr:hypothetical protein [Biomaibacter acetigenes]AYO30791.1 hypothetical protein D2962_09375 [Biomaibacter acetigenes]